MENPLHLGADATDLTLIETLRWTGAEFTRLRLHLDRLRRSTARLGWRCDIDLVQAVLKGALGADPARVRLTLDRSGEINVTTAPLPETAQHWRVGLAATSLSSDDPWLTVKSSRRATYDAARAALPPKLDEVIFLNERDEVCDGTITTLFFDGGPACVLRP